jgi:thiosulfate dehydrogenase [quinone] large subunit
MLSEELPFKSKSFHIVFIVLRVLLGGLFLEAGLDKVINGFSAAEYLTNGTGPFAGWFTSMASLGFINALVISGEILIGITLISGAMIRLASSGGIVMMLLYYLPYLPPANGWISQQIIYILIFITLIFSGSGYFFGIDRYAIGIEKRWPILRFLLG